MCFRSTHRQLMKSITIPSRALLSIAFFIFLDNNHKKKSVPVDASTSNRQPVPAETGDGLRKEGFRQRPTLPHSFPCSTIGAEELNFRVRDGNGCCLFAIATEKSAQFGMSNFSSLYLCQLFCGQASRLISTSKLSTLLCLHTWPINLVVFEESSVKHVSTLKGYLISRGASRLDAFSGYPFRT
jgi:hypothetical protein